MSFGTSPSHPYSHPYKDRSTHADSRPLACELHQRYVPLFGSLPPGLDPDLRRSCVFATPKTSRSWIPPMNSSMSRRRTLQMLPHDFKDCAPETAFIPAFGRRRGLHRIVFSESPVHRQIAINPATTRIDSAMRGPYHETRVPSIKWIRPFREAGRSSSAIIARSDGPKA